MKALNYDIIFTFLLWMFGLLGVSFFLTWLITTVKKHIFPSNQSDSEQQEFSKRLNDPDFASLEARFACQLPGVLKTFYHTSKELQRKDFEIRLKRKVFTVGWFLPIDLKTFESRADRTLQYLPFACDGQGSDYYILPGKSDPAVWFRDFEEDAAEEVCSSLSEFFKLVEEQSN